LRAEQLEQRRLLAVDVTNVTSTTPDGSYLAGEEIAIAVTFNGPVSVTGSPQLRMSSGSNAFALFDATATGTLPSNTLRFKYVVQAGENSADLDYAAVTALELGNAAGGILDGAGTPAILSLPVPGQPQSLGWNKNLAVDTQAPSPTITLSRTAVGNVNNQATVFVTLSEPSTDFTMDDITVTDLNGTPILSTLSLFAGSGASYQAVFTPPAGFVGMVLFRVDASEFTDAAGNSNIVSIGSPGQLWVDTNAPVVKEVTSPTANGLYKVKGDVIDIDVHFNHRVAVGGTGTDFPYLELNSSTGARAEYLSINGSVVRFRYVVDTNEQATDLDYRTVDSLRGGYILRLDTGTLALRTLPMPGSIGSLSSVEDLRVDTRGPSVTISSSNYLLGVGQTATLTFILSEPADPASPFAFDDVTLSNPTAGTLDASSWLQVDPLTYTVVFTPQPAFAGSVGVGIAANKFKDAAGNDNTAATLANPIVINTANPGSPSVANLITGNTSPTLSGTTGANPLVTGQRLIVSVNGLNYDVRSGMAGMSVTGNTWSLSLGAASPLAGTWSPLSDGIYEVVVKVIDAFANQAIDGTTNELTIDTVVPTVVAVSSSNLDSPPAYGVGKSITINVTLSKPVTVTGGAPSLLLNSGAGATAHYILPLNPAIATTTLQFLYTVGAGQATPDLDYAAVSSLSTNGATIRDSALNDANLTLAAPGSAGSLGASKNIVIETAAPAAILTSDKATLKAGETAVVTITFNEDVVKPLTPNFGLTAGGGNIIAFTGPPVGKVFQVTFTPTVSVVGLGTVSLNAGAWLDLAGNPAAVASLTPAIVIDTGLPPAPTVNSLTTKNLKPTLTGTIASPLGVGETLTVTVNGSTFAVVPVGIGTTWSLDLAVASPVGGGSFAPLVGAPATTYLVEARTSDVAGNAVLATGTLTIDTVAPKVLSVSSSTPNGTYGKDSVILIDVIFDENVDLDPAKAGIPRLRLNTQPTQYAFLESGSASGVGTNKWTFKYTVAAGDSSSDLDYDGSASLELSGNGVIDAAGNDANTTLPISGAVGSLADSSQIVIETVAPSVTITTSQAMVKKGDLPIIKVTFTEPPVTLPSLMATFGAASALKPTMNAKEFEAIYTPVDDLEKAGGGPLWETLSIAADSYEDAGGNLGLGSSLQLQVDTKQPAVTIVASSTSLTAGQTVTVTFTWSEVINSFDDEKVMLEKLTLQDGSWTENVHNKVYTAVYVPESDFTGEGRITVPTGAAKDIAGNESVAVSSPITIDTAVAPSVVSVSAVTPNNFYNAGDIIILRVKFSEPLIGNLARLNLELNSSLTALASWKETDPDDSSSQLFSYRVGSADNASRLDYRDESSLTGSEDVTDRAGNPAILALPVPGSAGSLGASSAITIDNVAPEITKITAIRNGFYRLGQTLRVDVTFNEPITFTEIPQLLFSNGHCSNEAFLVAPDTIRFRYTIRPGDNATDLDATSLREGTIVDRAGNLATRTMPAAPHSLAGTSDVHIDTTVPRITGPIETATPTGSYAAGSMITLTVLLSEPVSVSGTPSLRLNVGADRYALYSGIGSDGKSMMFRYTVLPGDTASALDGFLTASVVDVAGNTASLVLPTVGIPGLPSTKTIKIDTTIPTVRSITPVSLPGTYGPNSTVQFSVVMSERVIVDTTGGVPSILLNTSPPRSAIYVSGIGTPVRPFIFEYRPFIGDVATVLNHTSQAAWQLNGATIKDAAGHTANLVLPAPSSSTSFGGPGTIAIDALIKVVSSIPATSTSPHGPIYTAAITQLDLVFNAPVTGVTLSSFQLYYQGRSVSLAAASISGSGTTYRLTLPRTATNLNGLYRLRIGGSGSGIQSGGAVMTAVTNLYWQKAAATVKK
jgi:hypothetical protein